MPVMILLSLSAKGYGRMRSEAILRCHCTRSIGLKSTPARHILTHRVSNQLTVGLDKPPHHK